ncbi:hypothetical protein ABZV91_06195 [Nocardia sp. NPDC004568]|uniref:hypothetical protein n=1 Tax=Nocardia sp. NPDC004568 TaxID=3154551 RepID=UPI0033B8B82D
MFLHPAASFDISDPPPGPSVNERLVAEGSAVMEPELQREPTSAPVADQVTAMQSAAHRAAVPYLAAIAHADVAAWDGRLGAIGACRARLDLEAAQRETREREWWGPDRLPGTDDDPRRQTTPDLDYPSTGGNGDNDSGGDGWFCRRHWWC